MTRRTLLATLTTFALSTFARIASAAPKPKYLYWRYYEFTGNDTLYLLKDWRVVKRDGNTIWCDYTYQGLGRWWGGTQNRFPPELGEVVGSTNELPDWVDY